MSKELEQQVEEEQASAQAALEELETDIVQGRPDKPEEEVESPAIPDKFKGKTKAEITKSYTELEAFNSRQGNEIGALRQQMNELMLQQQAPKAEEPPVDVDTLLEDPSKAINNAIDKNERLAQIERKLQQDELIRARSGFEGKHPDWQETIGNADFQNWVNASPVRQKMFEAADKRYNYEVADELFTLYGDIRQVKAQESQQNRDNRIKGDLNAAATETGLGGTKREKRYRRADLINLQVYQPEKYEAMQEEIRRAYEEKRVD